MKASLGIDDSGDSQLSMVKAALLASTFGLPTLVGVVIDVVVRRGWLEHDYRYSIFGLGVALCWSGSVQFFYERVARKHVAAFPLSGLLTLRAMIAWTLLMSAYVGFGDLWAGQPLTDVLVGMAFMLFILSIWCAVAIVPLSMLLALVVVSADPSCTERLAMKPN